VGPTPGSISPPDGSNRLPAEHVTSTGSSESIIHTHNEISLHPVCLVLNYPTHSLHVKHEGSQSLTPKLTIRCDSKVQAPLLL
jgi:SET domain-containing protein